MTNLDANVLQQGVPLVEDYKNLLRTQLFLEMESFSNTFLRVHAKALGKYRWVADPFHQWSRQWEYCFAYSYIRQFITLTSTFIHANDKIQILDAGSGCTFFPYYLVDQHQNCSVICCDFDSSLAPIFTEINKKRTANVVLNLYDLADTEYKANSFDIIYCISVLEHAHDYEDIIKDFKRILKQNGLLIITFDISLDNANSTITFSQSEDLLKKVCGAFRTENSHILREYQRSLQKSDIFNTEFARTFNKKSLPWKLTYRSFLAQLLRLKLPKRPFSNLTIFCGVWRKTSSN